MSFNIESVKLRLIGTRPLIMARGETANPFDKQSREIKRLTQKKGKSDEDYDAIARLQFAAAMYYDPDLGPYIPVDNLWKCCQEGASVYREGPKVKSNVIVKGFVGKEIDPGGSQLMDGDGKVFPKDLGVLYAKHCFLKMGKLQKKSILTSRPKFDSWSCDLLVEFTEIDKARVIDYFIVAGRLKAICAWRPQNGQFRVEVIK